MYQMTPPDHFRQAEVLLGEAETALREAGSALNSEIVPEARARRVALLLQAGALHAELAKVAVLVQTGRMAPEAGRAWEAALVTPANIAEARGEPW